MPGAIPPRRGTLAVGVTALILMTTGACTGGAAEPSSTPGTASGSASASADPDGTGPRYDGAGLNLCATTNLAPLAELSLTLRGTNPTPPPSARGAACLFEFRTSDGHPASLRVEAVTHQSADDAARQYRSARTFTVMTPDGTIVGVGVEAEGFVRSSKPGFAYTEFMINVRQGNLFLSVWLAVGSDTGTPKTTLAPKARAVAEATLAIVPTAAPR